MTTPPIRDLRAAYRRRGVPQHYSGWLHFAFTSFFALAGIGCCLFALKGVAGGSSSRCR